MNAPNASDLIPFANNARTICLAFVMFASRYYQGNISDETMNLMFAASKKDTYDKQLLENIKNIENIKYVLPEHVFKNKDNYEEALYKLFNIIINYGAFSYTMAANHEEGLNVSNYLKKDKNYYGIIAYCWTIVRGEINSIFSKI